MIERLATGPSNLERARCKRVSDPKFCGKHAGKWVGSAREEERRLYETIRTRMGAETDLIASCSSSGEEAKRESVSRDWEGGGGF